MCKPPPLFSSSKNITTILNVVSALKSNEAFNSLRVEEDIRKIYQAYEIERLERKDQPTLRTCVISYFTPPATLFCIFLMDMRTPVSTKSKLGIILLNIIVFN